MVIRSQTVDKLFILQLQQKGWGLAVGNQCWTINAPRRSDASRFYHTFLPLLGEIRSNLELVELKIVYPNCRKPYRIVPYMTGEFPMSQITKEFSELMWISDDFWLPNELGYPYPLIKALDQIANSTTLSGMSRATDHRQVVINSRMAAALPCTPKEAVKRDIRKFTLPEDLEKIEQGTRDSETFQVSYRTALDDNRQIWRRITNQYRVVVDRFGVPFRVGEVLDVQEISRPSAANTLPV